MKTRVILPLAALAAMVVLSGARDAQAFELLDRLLAGGRGCCQPACCHAEPACCHAEPSCCHAERACCHREAACCHAEPSCCDACCDPCCRRRPLRDLLARLKCCCRRACCAPACCEPSCCEPVCGCGH